MRKECCFALLIFLVISAIPSVIYSRTTNSAYAQTVSLPPSSSQEVAPFKKLYDEQKGPSNTVGVKITSPVKGQKVPVGELVVSGTSTDNATTDCQVYVDVNDIKPMQNTTAAGVGGQNDYSNWTFTYTSKYHLISEGVNELTAKLSCINNPANITKYYSVNVTGVATSLAAANNTAATTKNITTENNNQTKVSTDAVNQTRKQTLQVQQEPKHEIQSESASPANSAPLKETQKQEEEAQKESMTDGQKGELSTSEVVPLGKSSSDLNALTEEPEDTTVEDEEKLTELTEPAGELPDYSYDQEQIDEDELKPTETLSQPQESPEQQPLEVQEVSPEMIEQQPLEEDQPLETLSQPQESPEQQPLEVQEVSPEMIEQQPLEEDQPLETLSQPQESPEQQPLEADQPIDESPVQSLSHKTQPSPLGIQPLEEQPALSNQQIPESRIHAQEQPGKSVKGVKQAYEKDESVPFVLPFDSQDVTPSS